MGARDELLRLARAHLAAERGRPRRERVRADVRQVRRARVYPVCRPPRMELILARPEERLIVYGSLVPGGKYHHLLADMEAAWEPCLIRGRLGSYRGYPSFKWNPAGEPHPAWLVTSPDLPRKFRELDAFEGEAYSRRLIPAEAGSRLVIAYVYEGSVEA